MPILTAPPLPLFCTSYPLNQSPAINWVILTWLWACPSWLRPPCPYSAPAILSINHQLLTKSSLPGSEHAHPDCAPCPCCTTAILSINHQLLTESSSPGSEHAHPDCAPCPCCAPAILSINHQLLTKSSLPGSEHAHPDGAPLAPVLHQLEDSHLLTAQLRYVTWRDGKVTHLVIICISQANSNTAIINQSHDLAFS